MAVCKHGCCSSWDRHKLLLAQRACFFGSRLAPTLNQRQLELGRICKTGTPSTNASAIRLCSFFPIGGLLTHMSYRMPVSGKAGSAQGAGGGCADRTCFGVPQLCASERLRIPSVRERSGSASQRSLPAIHYAHGGRARRHHECLHAELPPRELARAGETHAERVQHRLRVLLRIVE